MIYRTYQPRPPLSEFVDCFWFYEGSPAYERERVMPQGVFELIIDLKSVPKRLYDKKNQSDFRQFRHAWISGAHSEYIIIEAAANASMMGVHFKAGGAYPIVRIPALEFHGKVVELEVLWGVAASLLREQLLDTPDVKQKFRVLESFLLERISGYVRVPTAVAQALKEFEQIPQHQPVHRMAAKLGVSHKTFIAEFSKWAGMSPKLFGRVQRFQRILAQIGTAQKVEWAGIACDGGYYDQAHFIRDFQSFSGLNPSRYLTDHGEYLNYVPMRDELGR